MNKYKKPLLIAAVVVDVAITIFLFVISIIMLAMIGKYGDPKKAAEAASGLILFLLQNTNVYFWAFVFPLFVLLAGNIVGLVFYVKKTSVKEAPAQLNDLSDEQREALKAELLKDLMKEKGVEAPENNKEK
jgi:ABC-type microcin C transport system permease subunit YejB